MPNDKDRSKTPRRAPGARETILPAAEKPDVDFTLVDESYLTDGSIDDEPIFEPDFDTDPETETEDITEEVAQVMARRFSAQAESSKTPADRTNPTILARETLAADVRMALETVHPEDREALLRALTMEMRPEDFGNQTETLLPASPHALEQELAEAGISLELSGSDTAAGGTSRTVLAFDELDDSGTLAGRIGDGSAEPAPARERSNAKAQALSFSPPPPPTQSTPARAPSVPGMTPVEPLTPPVDAPDTAPTMLLVNRTSNQMALDGPEETQSTPQGTRPIKASRFVDLGLIGVGGMGEVRRIFDRSLKRVLAVKIIRTELMGNERIVSRFISEAQATGQLQHPGIVPVHEVGRLSDGRYYFTMREIRGRDLSKVLREYHSDRDTLDETGTAWSLRRLTDAFLKVCEAVAYAHSRKVIHRDLKPENILIGEYGEVLVVDWGIARVMMSGHEDDDALGGDIVTSRSKDGRQQTVIGSVTGTPAYMPIEQASGDREAQGPWSDVYALGAILYEMLCGRQPYHRLSGRKILRALLEGPPEPLPDDAGIPEGLRAICNTAMAREPSDRYPSAAELAEVVSAWLDGAQRRDEADLLMRRAEAKRSEVRRLRARALALREDADEILDSTPAAAPVEDKEPAWAALERAERLERGADMLEVTLTFNVRAALERFPDLDDGHDMLFEVYKRRLDDSENAGDATSAERNLTMLRAHSRGRHAPYLTGEGAVTLITDPPGAEVQIFRYVEKNRRLELQPVGDPLYTPMREVELPMGSYLLSITKDGRLPVRYPVNIGRGEHRDGIAPGDTEPTPIRLPRSHEVPPGQVYVPSGWFALGGDPRAPNTTERRDVWVDGFVMRMYPVTHFEYLAFLQYLINSYREEDAQSLAPMWTLQGHRRGQSGFVRDTHGNFALPVDQNNALIGADLPVMRIDWNAAMTYAHYLAEDHGLPWRLPHEVEWEKAARGTDSRAFPMGPFLDPTWACMGESHTEYVLPSPVQAYDSDASAYGVRGLGGNARDWCRNQYSSRDLDIVDGRLYPERIRPQASGPVYRSTRGGAWSATVDECRCASRSRHLQDDTPADVTIRLVRSFK